MWKRPLVVTRPLKCAKQADISAITDKYVNVEFTACFAVVFQMRNYISHQQQLFMFPYIPRLGQVEL